MNDIDWHAVSGSREGPRGTRATGARRATAAKLGVDEQELRDAFAGRSRRAMLAVLAGVSRVFGLDPTWLLTGEYDASTHRTALQSDTAEIARVMHDIVSRERDAPDVLSQEREQTFS